MLIVRIKGAVFVELLLVIPIVLVLGFCCIELSNALRVEQTLVTLSRDMASSALRRCGELDDTTHIKNCLESIHDIFIDRSTVLLDIPSQNINNDLKFLLSVYKYPNDCMNPPFCPDIRKSFPESGNVLIRSRNEPSKFRWLDFFPASGRYHDLITKSRIVVTAEVFLAYNPIVSSSFAMMYPSVPGVGGPLFNEVAVF